MQVSHLRQHTRYQPTMTLQKILSSTSQLKKTNLNVTVPTTIDFTFKSDGTNILPTLPIVNHSIADIKLLNISLDNSQAATPEKWTIADYATFNKNIGVNTYQLGLQAHMGETTQAFSATNNHLSTATFNKVIPVANDIATGTTQNITFDVKHGAFTNIVNAEKAFDVTFSFDFA